MARQTRATRHPAYDLFEARSQAAERMLGNPTTPLFSISDFISLELYQARAFDTSATSWRSSTSLGSSALRNTLLLVMPADVRFFSFPLLTHSGVCGFVRRAKGCTMQVPSILRGESRTRLLQGIAIGAVASMVIGFSWGGWVTGGAATKLADERADTAVVAALTPICVEKFMQNSDAKANLAALQKISTNWEQGQYLEKGGWATRPGATSSDYHLARACAEKLVQLKTAAQ
jgi:hypothetical protein